MLAPPTGLLKQPGKMVPPGRLRLPHNYMYEFVHYRFLWRYVQVTLLTHTFQVIIRCLVCRKCIFRVEPYGSIRYGSGHHPQILESGSAITSLGLLGYRLRSRSAAVGLETHETRMVITGIWPSQGCGDLVISRESLERLTHALLFIDHSIL